MMTAVRSTRSVLAVNVSGRVGLMTPTVKTLETLARFDGVAPLLEWTRAHIPCFCWSYSEMRSDAHEAVVAVLEDEPVPGMFMEFGRLWVACKRRGARGRAQLKGAQ